MEDFDAFMALCDNTTTQLIESVRSTDFEMTYESFYRGSRLCDFLGIQATNVVNDHLTWEIRHPFHYLILHRIAVVTNNKSNEEEIAECASYSEFQRTDRTENDDIFGLHRLYRIPRFSKLDD